MIIFYLVSLKLASSGYGGYGGVAYQPGLLGYSALGGLGSYYARHPAYTTNPWQFSSPLSTKAE